VQAFVLQWGVCVFANYRPQQIFGGGHFCAILDDFDLKCWGPNTGGKLGIGVSDAEFAGWYVGDEANEIGDHLPLVVLGTARSARHVSSGEKGMCVVLDNHEVKCFGYRDSGVSYTGNDRIGIDPSDFNYHPTYDLGTGRTVLQTAKMLDSTCALLDNSAVKCWGQGSWGELGYGDLSARHAASALGDNLPEVDLGTSRTAKKIVAGENHACAILDDDTLKCWGRNYYGTLGIDSFLDTGVGDAADEMGDFLPVVGLGAAVIDVAAGFQMTCAILVDGNVKCWGPNMFSNLGYGDTHDRGTAEYPVASLPALDLGTGKAAQQIAVIYDAGACALLNDTSVKCWGRSDVLLGYGDTEARSGALGDSLPTIDLGTGKTVQQLVAARFSFCALLTDGASGQSEIKCWGPEGMMLGYGDAVPRGGGPEEMGKNLPSIQLGAIQDTYFKHNFQHDIPGHIIVINHIDFN
ncbi:UVR8, partial [Symbiodinium pilosum]